MNEGRPMKNVMISLTFALTANFENSFIFNSDSILKGIGSVQYSSTREEAAYSVWQLNAL